MVQARVPQAVLMSPRLAVLQAAVANGDTTAQEAFWAEVAEVGTPLVEAYDAATRQCLVTFVLRDGQPRPFRAATLTHAIRVYEGEERALQRLSGTDVWFRTWRVRSDLRMAYGFLLDVEAVDPRDSNAPSQPATATALPDPHNPDRYTAVDDIPGAWGGDAPEHMSILELPDAEPLPWLERRPERPVGEIHTHQITSDILGNTRTVWVSTPPGYDPDAADAEPCSLLLIFDGDMCVQPLGVPMLLDTLLEAGEIRPTIAVMVGNVVRHIELPCHEPFADFLAQELIPWVRARYRVTTNPADTVVCGLSYGGLCSAFVALRHPELFGNVLSQSGSFWWKPYTREPGPGTPPWGNPALEEVGEHEWLTGEYIRQPTVPVTFYMEAGNLEVRAPATNATTLLAASWHFRDVLRLKGYDVHYREYTGGHDAAWWRGTLADGMVILVGRDARAARAVSSNSSSSSNNTEATA